MTHQKDLHNDLNTLYSLPRMLLIWHGIPSLRSGVNLLMWRILKHYPQDKIWHLTSATKAFKYRDYDPIPDVTRQRYASERFFLGKNILLTINWLTLPFIILRGVQLVYQQRIEALFTSPYSRYFIAAYYVHKLTQCPLYVYVMDDEITYAHPPEIQPVSRMLARKDQNQGIELLIQHHVEMVLDGIKMANRVLFITQMRLDQMIYRRYFPKILRASRQVWSIGETMRDFLQVKYGVSSELLPPFCDVEAFQQTAIRTRPVDDAEIRIIYSGGIYAGHQEEPLKNLVNVLHSESLRQEIREKKVTLTIYTGVPESTLRQIGIWGEHVVHGGFVHPSELPRIYADAEILFFPFAFDEGDKHFVQTSFSSKSAEYLASGTPILVHAPTYASISKYCKKYNTGLVVDVNDQVILQRALIELVSNKDMRNLLSLNASEYARRDFHQADVIKRFLNRLSEHYSCNASSTKKITEILIPPSTLHLLRCLKQYLLQVKLYKQKYPDSFNPFEAIRFFPTWYQKTIRSSSSPLTDGLPWMTFSAVKFLEQVTRVDMSVYEYGSSGSTLFWAKRVQEVVSVEHDEAWLNEIQNLLKIHSLANIQLSFIKPDQDIPFCLNNISSLDAYMSYMARSSFKHYVMSIDKFPDSYFDIITVDGRARPSCLKHSISKVKVGGYIVLDDADRSHYQVAIQSMPNNFVMQEFVGPRLYSIKFTKTLVWCRRS